MKIDGEASRIFDSLISRVGLLGWNYILATEPWRLLGWMQLEAGLLQLQLADWLLFLRGKKVRARYPVEEMGLKFAL